MHGLSAHDGDRAIDWTRTSDDYARWRPNYPASFFDRLFELGIGRDGQHILDLGTGVGFLAVEFARRGAQVVGVDIAEGQIEMARRRATEAGLAERVEFRVCPAEASEFPDQSLDVITASQSWLYFDHERMVREVRRLLRPGGRLVTSHFCWLPREDSVAARSEALVLEHNPDWACSDWPGEIPTMPEWARGAFDLVHFFVYDEGIPFTRERWRGRIRACRGVGAALTPDEVDRFDQAHAALLDSITDADEFTIRHRIDAHILAVR